MFSWLSRSVFFISVSYSTWSTKILYFFSFIINKLSVFKFYLSILFSKSIQVLKKFRFYYIIYWSFPIASIEFIYFKDLSRTSHFAQMLSCFWQCKYLSYWIRLYFISDNLYIKCICSNTYYFKFKEGIIFIKWWQFRFTSINKQSSTNAESFVFFSIKVISS